MQLLQRLKSLWQRLVSKSVPSSYPKNPTDLDLLKCARSLITDPEHWTTQAYARLSNKGFAYIHAPDTHSYCAQGAIYKAIYLHMGDVHYFAIGRPILNLLEKNLDGQPLMVVNDCSTHERVLSVFDKTIADLEKQ